MTCKCKKKRKRKYQNIESSPVKIRILKLLAFVQTGLRKTDIAKQIYGTSASNVYAMIDRLFREGYLQRTSANAVLCGNTIYRYTLSQKGERAVSYVERYI